jgi:phosphate starvation-inducible PhoH-like protein
MSKGLSFELQPEDNARLANLCGQFNQHLHQLEHFFDAGIDCRGNQFEVHAKNGNAQAVMDAVKALYAYTEEEILTPSSVQLFLSEVGGDDAGADAGTEKTDADLDDWGVKTRKGTIRGRGKHQKAYLKQIQNNDLTLGVGPAGTGKTYLAVACAVNALENDHVERLILVRPAVEAGERLGFLPGDLAQKIDPYLRPMYDALYDMMGTDKVAKLIERNIIEIAPLAYMRGRTLNDAFIILDEAQNTTTDQMKMFLTRIGFGSRAVVTGDVTQVDLPREKISGLRHAMHLLENIESIGITQFDARDVVRHPLVKKIVDAYEKAEGS